MAIIDALKALGKLDDLELKMASILTEEAQARLLAKFLSAFCHGILDEIGKGKNPGKAAVIGLLSEQLVSELIADYT